MTDLDETLQQEWREAWQLPQLPTWALLGPDRTIMAIEPSIGDIRAIFGLTNEQPSTRSHRLNRLRPSSKKRRQP